MQIPMRLRVDEHSPIPIRRQLTEQLKRVIEGSSSAAERVRGFAGPAGQVMIDDRALNQRAVETLAAILVGQDGERTAAAPPPGRRRLSPRLSRGRPAPGGGQA
jgi:hypothetical protein